MPTKFIATLSLEFAGRPTKKSVRVALLELLQGKGLFANDRKGTFVPVIKARVRTVDED